MVLVTLYPNLEEASCCNVEVVKGAEAERVPGFVSTFRTLNSVVFACSRIFLLLLLYRNLF
jgi:hypothetical protein